MRKKKRLILFLLGCLAVLTIGSSFAFWSGKIEHTNVLKADKMKAEIDEVFEGNPQPTGTVQKEVTFKNSSSSAAFLRVSYGETWQRTEGGEEVLLNNQINGTDVATKNWQNGFGANSDLWTDGGDGWFYYNRVLEPSGETEKILTEVTFPDYDEREYRDYCTATYQLYFRMELLQVSDSQFTLNSDEVNKKASSSVFGKEAVINVDGTTVSWK